MNISVNSSLAPSHAMLKYLLQDFFVTLMFAFFYLLAAIAWSAGTDTLKSFNNGLLVDRLSRCYNCSGTTIANAPVTQNFVQLRFSLVRILPRVLYS